MRPLIWILLGACASSADPESSSIRTELDATGCRDHTLAWTEVGLRPAAPESPAWGPQAIAVAPSGEAFVLDALEQRVLGVGAAGEVRVVATGIARDAEALAVGADGALAVFSPLQGKAWVLDPDGAPAGALTVDRAFRHVTGLALGRSRQLRIGTAYQESFSAGSPAAPLDLASSLRGKREGAFVLDNGDGVAVRAARGTAELLVIPHAPGGRAAAKLTHPLPGPIDAATLVGLAGDVACVRAEQVTQDSALRVQRRAICLDVTTGRVVLDRPLAKPGLYLPRQELAVGGAVPRIASLEPTTEGLNVRICEVGR